MDLKFKQTLVGYYPKFCATIVVVYFTRRTDCRSKALWLGWCLCLSFVDCKVHSLIKEVRPSGECSMSATMLDFSCSMSCLVVCLHFLNNILDYFDGTPSVKNSNECHQFLPLRASMDDNRGLLFRIYIPHYWESTLGLSSYIKGDLHCTRLPNNTQMLPNSIYLFHILFLQSISIHN